MSAQRAVARMVKPDVVEKRSAPPTNTAELRSFLLDQMCAVADGRQQSDYAKAICNYAQQIYNTMNMELRYALSTKNLGGAPVKSVSFVADAETKSS